MARKYPVFRKCCIWTVQNEKLYNLMSEHSVTTVKLAELCDVTPRSVERWIYDNSLPKPEKRDIISDLFNLPSSEIFDIST